MCCAEPLVQEADAICKLFAAIFFASVMAVSSLSSTWLHVHFIVTKWSCFVSFCDPFQVFVSSLGLLFTCVCCAYYWNLDTKLVREPSSPLVASCTSVLSVFFRFQGYWYSKFILKCFSIMQCDRSVLAFFFVSQGLQL